MNGRGSVLLPAGGKTRTDDYATPVQVYRALDAEFGFTLDACPLADGGAVGMGLFGSDALLKSWRGERVYCNPPYRNILPWMAKADEADVAVYLVPARTDTLWWHRHAMKANEIRFIRGRLRFGTAKANAPFPSVVLVFRKEER